MKAGPSAASPFNAAVDEQRKCLYEPDTRSDIDATGSPRGSRHAGRSSRIDLAWLLAVHNRRSPVMDA